MEPNAADGLQTYLPTHSQARSTALAACIRAAFAGTVGRARVPAGAISELAPGFTGFDRLGTRTAMDGWSGHTIPNFEDW